MKAVYGVFAITFLFLFIQLIYTIKDMLTFKKECQALKEYSATHHVTWGEVFLSNKFDQRINSDIKMLILLLISALLMCINNVVHFFWGC